jgi:hypothetical protein
LYVVQTAVRDCDGVCGLCISSHQSMSGVYALGVFFFNLRICAAQLYPSTQYDVYTVYYALCQVSDMGCATRPKPPSQPRCVRIFHIFLYHVYHGRCRCQPMPVCLILLVCVPLTTLNYKTAALRGGVAGVGVCLCFSGASEAEHNTQPRRHGLYLYWRGAQGTSRGCSRRVAQPRGPPAAALARHGADGQKNRFT